jgi:hypothetical protein
MSGKDAKLKWEMPMIFSMGGLPEAWGNCVGGSTEVAGTCGSGQSTGSSGDYCATGDQPGEHKCTNGSSPDNCVTGPAPAWFGPCQSGGLTDDLVCSTGGNGS